MGSPNAAIIMDLLSAIQPKACLFLGKCGGIDKKNRIGDLILPIAAIRGEGTSNDYFPHTACFGYGKKNFQMSQCHVDSSFHFLRDDRFFPMSFFLFF